MKRVKITSHIDSNGILWLSVSDELRNMDVIVTVKAIDLKPKTPEELGWSLGFLSRQQAH